ncbi:MAG: GWxTD domain-containing protein [Candidatus Latescibacteria bacterium]|nr:GWxTD domain-containing protein [bacterium]MBD3424397.1 GWxTD domain-containing protein [Candidatus Latescibacterota bacterium]
MRCLINIFISTVIIAVSGCSPVNPPASRDRECLEADPGLSEEQIRDRIEILKRELSDNRDNCRLHHLLAIYYKLASTPYSRSLADREIDRAIELNPGDPELYMEKGRINMARRFYGDAEAAFRKAAEIDPDNYDAWCNLGLMKKRDYTRSMCFPEYGSRAAELYAGAVEIDSTRSEALRELITLHLLLGKSGKAIRCAGLLKRYHEDSPFTHLLLGIIHLEKKEFAEAEEEFSISLEMMPLREKSHYIDISPFLQENEYRRFMNLPAEFRDDYIRKFWLDRDPTPTTVINERVLEHYRRVYFARYLFRNEHLGFSGPDTDRGRSLIRYGMPDRVHIPFDQGAIRATDASLIAWDYGSGAGGFRLYFMDEFLNGDYHIPIDRRFKRVSRSNLNIELALPERYRYPVDYQWYSIHTRIIQRRGREGKTDLYISTSIPAGRISGKDYPLRILFSIMDGNRNRIYNRNIAFSPDTLKSIRKGNMHHLLLRHRVGLAPRIGECTYHVACIDSSAMARGNYGFSFRFIDFSTPRLILSDVALSISGSGTGCGIWADGRAIYPTGGHLCLSYDIYNLQRNSMGESNYRLTYTIIPYKEKKEGVIPSLLDHLGKITGSDRLAYTSNSLTLNAYGSSVSDRLTIDTGDLEEGEYILRLEVTDLLEKKTADRNSYFVLGDLTVP